MASLDQNVRPPPPPPHLPVTYKEVRLAHNLVVRLLEGLWHHGHIVVMDNHFSSVVFFLDLLLWSTYATATMRANYIGVLKDLKSTKAFKNVSQGMTL